MVWGSEWNRGVGVGMGGSGEWEGRGARPLLGGGLRFSGKVRKTVFECSLLCNNC